MDSRGELPDEQAHIRRAQANPRDFAPLYDHYLPRVYKFYRYRVDDIATAQDLTARTFERALADIKRYQAERAPFGAWLFGAPNTVVIGASGVIFGLLGFLLFRGLAERSAGAITVSIMMLVIYGGSISGIFPGAPFVSWQSHLFGFIGGAGAAFLLRRPRPRSYASGPSWR